MSFYYMLSIFFGIVAMSIIIKRKQFIIHSRKIAIYYVLLAMHLLFYFIQFIFIDHSNINVMDQYPKGLVVVVVNFAISTFIIVSIDIYSNIINLYMLLKILRNIGMINILYNVIQIIFPEIDFYFILLTRSTVSRYGVEKYGGSIGRLTGLFTDSNNNAAFLVLYFWIVFCLIKLKQSDGIKGGTFDYCLMFLCVLEVVMTYSRTGIIALAISMGIIFLKEGLFKNKILMTFCIFIVALLIYLYFNSEVFYDIISVRLSGIINLRNNTHFRLATTALEVFMGKFSTIAFGVGFNCLSCYYGILIHDFTMKAHSIYLQTLAEEGIIGFSLLIARYALLICMLTKSYKKTVKRSEKNFWFYFISMVFVFYIMNATYDSAVQGMFSWIVFLVLFAESAPYSQKYYEQK